MSNFGRRDAAPNRRWIKRRRVGIPAQAELAGCSVGALVQDLTMTGARLLGGDLPGPGTTLTLQVGTRRLSGEVVWAAGDHRGLRLDFARR